MHKMLIYYENKIKSCIKKAKNILVCDFQYLGKVLNITFLYAR